MRLFSIVKKTWLTSNHVLCKTRDLSYMFICKVVIDAKRKKELGTKCLLLNVKQQPL